MARRIKKDREPKGPRLTEAEDELITLAARIIDDHYSALGTAKISYWMINGNWRKGGELVDASVEIVSGANRKETGNIFRVYINQAIWSTANEKLKAYILDNQLSRLCRGETGAGEDRWYIRDFTVKAFPSIISRYGIITEEIRQLDAAFRQQILPFDVEVDKAANTAAAVAAPETAEQVQLVS